MKTKPLFHARGLVVLFLSQRSDTGANLVKRVQAIDSISQPTVYQALNWLVADGRVSRTGASRQGKRYMLTDAGRELAAQLRAIVAAAAAAFPVRHDAESPALAPDGCRTREPTSSRRS